jgi:hypothetical protein
MTIPVCCKNTGRRSALPACTLQGWKSINPSNTLAKARNNVLLASTTKELIKSFDDLLSADGILQQSHSHRNKNSSRGCSTKLKIKRRNAMDLINNPVVIDDEGPEEEERRNVLDRSVCDCLRLDSTFSTTSESSSLSSSLSSSSSPLCLLKKYDCDGSISLFDSKAISEETSCACRPRVLGEMERTSNKHSSDHEEYDSTGDDDLSTACTAVSSSSSSSSD